MVAAVTLLAAGGAITWTVTAPGTTSVALADRGRIGIDSSEAQGAPHDECGLEPVDAKGWAALLDAHHDVWSGGDGGSSTRLPDGGLLWLFGDSFSGDVGQDGSRAAATQMARNAVVVTDGSCLESLSPGRDALPGDDGTWLWPTHAVVVEPGFPSTVLLMAQRMATDPSDALGFRRAGTALVTLSVPTGGTPVVTSVSDLPASDVLWGAALAADGPVTWIYGTRPSATGTGRDLLLARVATSELGDHRAWVYRTSTGWSRDPARAAVVLRGAVSTVPSARVRDGRTLIVTKPGEFLDPNVAAIRSAHPWGPWKVQTLFQEPSTSDRLSYSPALVAVRAGLRQVVLVNHTSTDLQALVEDGSLADPSFHDM